MPPETIAGRYDVVREVGRGGMGAVWLCRDRTLGREVAVKQVGGLPGESTPMLARALREARTSAALNHPNVVSIYDAIEDSGHVWLVMEYLPSRTLSQIIKEGPLDHRRAARIAAQVADGLAAAHARGTVHRDVKPGNILVTEDDVAKISDFGISRTLGDDQLTQTGLVSGTPLYFSPALARGGDPTAADDVWALGASLYAAVEGEPPWPAQENSIAMLMHIVNHQPPVPQRAGVLTEPIRRMMNVDPDARPTMADTARALHAVAAGRGDEDPTVIIGGSAVGTEPSPAPTRPETVPPSDPEPTPAAPVPAPATTSTPTPRPVAAVPSDEPYDDRPARSDGRRRTALLAALAVLVLAIGGALLLGVLGDDDPTTTASDDPTGTTSSEATEPSDPATSEDGGEEPAPDPTTEAPPEEETTEPAPETTDAPAGGEPAEVVEGYYALLPDDTRSAWELLGPELQAEVGSYGDYRAFWNTIDSVSVDSTEPTGEETVLVGLTYNGDESETREFTVVDGLIVDDGEPQ